MVDPETKEILHQHQEVSREFVVCLWIEDTVAFFYKTLYRDVSSVRANSVGNKFVGGKNKLVSNPQVTQLMNTFIVRLDISFLYVCMLNTIYLLSFVETPRKFIIAEFSIRKLGSSSVL